MTKYLNRFKKPYSSKKHHSTETNTSESLHCNAETTDIKNFRSGDPWSWDYVLDEEVYDLLEACYVEVKSRGVMIPLVFLPFRPMSNVLSTKVFIRKFFSTDSKLQKDQYIQELPLIDIYVIIGIIRWCWLRLIDGVVGWDVYEAFTILEKEKKYPYNAFFDYIPIVAGSKVRENIILGFFNILSAIAAYSKINGLSGDKLSRTAGWWAFNFENKEQGFHKAYNNWKKSADANEHLFFAYLRSIKEQHSNTELYVPNSMPLSLVKLLEQTPYPLLASSLMTLHHKDTLCIDMLVNMPSPNAFTVLQRVAIQGLDADDEIVSVLWKHRNRIENALTDESRRILMCISDTLTNASSSTGSKEWENFLNFGFDYIKSEPENLKIDLVYKTDKSDTCSENKFNEYSSEESRIKTYPSISPKEVSLCDVLPCDNTFLSVNKTQFYSELNSATKINTEWLNESTISNKRRISLDESFWGVWIDSCSEETPVFRKKMFEKFVLFEIELEEKKWIIVEEQNNKNNRRISFDSFHINSSIENKQKIAESINKYEPLLSNSNYKIKRNLSEYFKYQKNKFNIINRYRSVKAKKSIPLLEYKQDVKNSDINNDNKKKLHTENSSIEKLNSIKLPFSYKKLEYMIALNNNKEQLGLSQTEGKNNISTDKIEKKYEKIPVKDLNLYSYSMSTNKRYGVFNKFNLEISSISILYFLRC
ncbi:hypothetical protein PMAC_001499 [Pneumocystis sp. 'macacae']|nr:hypothetical protein PMAC_001499 [Pneumocystis sp. 'macacae']